MPAAKTAIVIGAGVGGLLTASLLGKRNWRVHLVDEKFAATTGPELPYVCSKMVSDFFEREAPEVLAELRSGGARFISIAEILRSRFPDVRVSSRDEGTSFLCMSRTLLQAALVARVRSREIDIHRERVDGLVRENQRVSGVKLSSGKTIEADFVVDSTGAAGPRATWLEALGIPGETITTLGPSYLSLAKFYRKSANAGPVDFALASGRNFRGGIYPLENDRFAIALIVPETTTIGSPEEFFAESLKVIPGASEKLREATEWSHGLQVVRGIRNRSSDFYDSSEPRLRGYFPVGDSVLCGNPIYGRGISLMISQLEGLLSALGPDASIPVDETRVHKKVAEGLRHARRFWADGAFADRADEPPIDLKSRALRAIRDTYVATVIPQLQTSPELTRRFLYNYQLMLPAWRITGPRQYWTALRKLGEMSR